MNNLVLKELKKIPAIFLQNPDYIYEVGHELTVSFADRKFLDISLEKYSGFFLVFYKVKRDIEVNQSNINPVASLMKIVSFSENQDVVSCSVISVGKYLFNKFDIIDSIYYGIGESLIVDEFETSPSLLKKCDDLYLLYIRYLNNINKTNELNIFVEHFPASSKITFKLLINYVIRELNLSRDQKLKLFNNIDDEQNIDFLISSLVRKFDLNSLPRNERNEMLDDEDTSVEESDVMRLANKLKDKKLPKDVNEIALRELKRIKMMNSASSEYHVIENYLNNIVEYPWNDLTKSKTDVVFAKKVLNDEHEGMESVKKRILQHLSVMQLKKNSKISVICLYGPPGVGKTSICKSIARSLGRKYYRIGLGGMTDESEIRGHRRTYVGAMPGKLAQAMIRLKTKNPVILLDEIDKLGSTGFKGNIESALLEVLDPEQNHSFNDHYMGVGIDLSQVLFIATANDISKISGPLRDRLEIIELSGYTVNEKVNIAKKHLLVQEKIDNGIDKLDFDLSDGVLKTIISKYTREAGVRKLRQKIKEICRNVAENYLENDNVLKVDETNLVEILGNKFIVRQNFEEKLDVGTATGMAWTPFGGEVLFVETVKMKGSGQYKLTGQLGDVMKESISIAMTVIKSRADFLKIKMEDFNTNDVHIHFPDGATPKDGPSAGITLVTALTSLFLNKKVNSDIAMTGEVSLTGKVLPVGGIKEKLLGAYEYGCKTIIIPKANEKDLSDLPVEVRNSLNVKTVEKIEEVIDLVFK